MKGKLNLKFFVFWVEMVLLRITQALNFWVQTFWTTYSWARISWVPNRKASGGMANKLVDLVVAAVVMGALVPYAIITIINTNTTGWDTTSKALWLILPTLAVLGIFILFIRMFLGRKTGGL